MRSARKTEETASTPSLLIRAAAAEFNAVGFDRTDTNKIARRAGFSPQTFYRHFSDKLDIFLAVYDVWSREESIALERAFGGADEASKRLEAATNILIAFHRDNRLFRQALRQLAITEDCVRVLRTRNRERQIKALEGLRANRGRSRASLFAGVLTLARLCDALTESEHADLKLTEAALVKEVKIALKALRGE
jgi:AcrR family transcriptional regulator